MQFVFFVFCFLFSLFLGELPPKKFFCYFGVFSPQKVCLSNHSHFPIVFVSLFPLVIHFKIPFFFVFVHLPLLGKNVFLFLCFFPLLMFVCLVEINVPNIPFSKHFCSICFCCFCFFFSCLMFQLFCFILVLFSVWFFLFCLQTLKTLLSCNCCFFESSWLENSLILMFYVFVLFYFVVRFSLNNELLYCCMSVLSASCL